MNKTSRILRTITITIEGPYSGVRACNTAMGQHIFQALNFRPQRGTKVSLNIREDWIDDGGNVITDKVIETARVAILGGKHAEGNAGVMAAGPELVEALRAVLHANIANNVAERGNPAYRDARLLLARIEGRAER